MTTNYDIELAKLNFQGNIVLDIGGVIYSQYQVDSGLVVPTDNVGLVNTINVNGLKVDIRTVKTTTPTVSFGMLDKDGKITADIGNDAGAWVGLRVKFYWGYKTGSFDWSDYSLVSTGTIRGWSKIKNGYTFNATDITDFLKQPVLNIASQLDGAISDTSTSITLLDATNFPTSGLAKIEDEFISWTGKATNTLTGVSRSDLASTADSHDDDTEIFLVTVKEAHALDIFLDVLENDLGVPVADIDVDGIEDIRDNKLGTDGDFLLYMYEVESALEWLEDNILLPTNCRMFTKGGKITLSILDQVSFAADAPEINEDHIRSQPKYTININQIVNKITVRWDFSEGRGVYTRINSFTDADSIALYGTKELTYEYRGVTAANGGSAIVTDRAGRLLQRLAYPKAEIDIETHFNRFGIDIAENVLFSHRYLPQSGGGLGMSALLEVISKAPRGFTSDAKVRWKVAFTSFTGIRFGLVAASPILSLDNDTQTRFEVPDTSCYSVGFKLRLWDITAGAYTSDTLNTVAAIDGDYLVMENAWTTTLSSNLRLKFGDYDECSTDQRARYAFICYNSGIFISDGTKAYQILV